MLDFTNPYLSIADSEFLDAVGAKRRQEILNSGCFRAKYQRIPQKTKAVCKKIQDEYKAFSITKHKSLNVEPKWVENFEEKMREKQKKTTPAKPAAKKPTAKKPVAKKPAGCKRPNQVRNPATGRCIDAARLRRQAAKKPAAKKSSPKKSPSPVKKSSPKPPTPFQRLPGMTIKQTCRATAVNKCRSPCSVIRLPNGKQMCTQVKKPAKLPTKRTMYALARMA